MPCSRQISPIAAMSWITPISLLTIHHRDQDRVRPQSPPRTFRDRPGRSSSTSRYVTSKPSRSSSRIVSSIALCSVLTVMRCLPLSCRSAPRPSSRGCSTRSRPRSRRSPRIGVDQRGDLLARLLDRLPRPPSRTRGERDAGLPKCSRQLRDHLLRRRADRPAWSRSSRDRSGSFMSVFSCVVSGAPTALLGCVICDGCRDHAAPRLRRLLGCCCRPARRASPRRGSRSSSRSASPTARASCSGGRRWQFSLPPHWVASMRLVDRDDDVGDGDLLAARGRGCSRRPGRARCRPARAGAACRTAARGTKAKSSAAR